jgi:serine/threonine protein kinase
VSLSPGTKFGPYEITGALGAGGMGEVYRARDTRLNRIVAIKVLPSDLSSNPDLKQRFEREAKAISSLNHPHICTLFDVGHQEGVDFLVMEYLEGETLADRLQKGALPIDRVLKIGIEIADALDKAHRQKIIHRDLKPGNIMLTKAGAKLLDFGLAKPAAMAALTGSAPLLSAAATTMPPASPLTTAGTVVGTIQYMSPEQLEGKEADARSDIFSLGSVLYEMATGKRAFEGKSQISVASAILEKDPEPIIKLLPMAPAALDRVVKTCLAKDPDERWQSAHDVAAELKWIQEGGSQSGESASAGTRTKRWVNPGWLAATVLLLALGVSLLTQYSTRRETPPQSLLRFSVPAPKSASFGISLSISPDGKFLAFEGDSEGSESLWVRPMDSLEAHPMAGTESAFLPFWSPDSRFLGFFSSGKMKKVDISTGAIQTICDVVDPRGGTWSPEGLILFAPDATGPLYQVSAGGGAPAPVTKIIPSTGESSHRWPFFLPDGRHFVYLSRHGGGEEETIFVGSLDSSEPARVLTAGSMVIYAPPGYLLFVRGQTLMAQPFDPARLRLGGEPVAIAEGVEPVGEIGPTSYAPVAVSNNGVLVYRSGASALTQMAWFDRSGSRLSDIGPPGLYDEPSLSPDGQRIAFDRTDPKLFSTDIWLLSLSSGTFSRFTFGPKAQIRPVWSPDGSRIVFSSNRSGPYDLYQKASNGAANEEPLLSSPSGKFPLDWSADGRYLIYEKNDANKRTALWVLQMSGEKTSRLFQPGSTDQTHAAISPDGRWVAYTSNETGRQEVFVQSFPAAAGKWQISTEGGDQPQWRRDGKELFFLSPDNKLMVVPIQGGSGTFQSGASQVLFKAPVGLFSRTDSRSRYAIMPDGRRVLVLAISAQSSSSSLTVVTNWTSELKK